VTYFDNVKHCNEYLLSVMPEMRIQAEKVPGDEQSQRRLMRFLMNICPPTPFSDAFCTAQDAVLSEDVARKGVIRLSQLQEREPGIYLWRGDITRLKVDAIVNAANNKMLGCFVPFHGCIDNAIHSAAGLQLRNECSAIMSKQNGDEPTGIAKITDAYNLPCSRIIHTVGPIVFGRLLDQHRELLENSYRACYRLAANNGLASIAFCCISTGEFLFPKRDAAQIAVDTVRELKQEHGLSVVFNVFKEEDYAFYDELLL